MKCGDGEQSWLLAQIQIVLGVTQFSFLGPWQLNKQKCQLQPGMVFSASSSSTEDAKEGRSQKPRLRLAQETNKPHLKGEGHLLISLNLILE